LCNKHFPFSFKWAYKLLSKEIKIRVFLKSFRVEDTLANKILLS
jgi:hypothetical protein